MEYLEGQTLKHRIGGRSLPVNTLVELAIQITDPLEAALAKGIIHRDIKPTNLLITDRGPAVQAKVLDFGLAKLQRPDAAAALHERSLDARGSLQDELEPPLPGER